MSAESLHHSGTTAGPVVHPVPRAPGVNRFPASACQARIYVRNETAPHSGACLPPVALRLRGRPDIFALQAALADLGARHEALRTGFEFDPTHGPTQVVHQPDQVTVRFVRGVTSQEEIGARIARASNRPFALAAPPLLRAELWEVEDTGDWVLLLCAHSIIADRRSLDVLVADLVTAYQARIAGGGPQWSALAVQPADIAAHERALLQDKDPPTATEPVHPPRTPLRSDNDAKVAVELPSDLVGALRAVGPDLFTTLFTGLAVVLGRWSARSDVVIGRWISGRPCAELDGLVGHLDKVVAQRIDLAGAATFRELLLRAETGAPAANDCALHDGGSGLRPTAVRALLSVRDRPVEPPRMPRLTTELLAVPRTVADVDLCVELSPTPAGGLTGLLVYGTDMFDASTARRLVEALEAVCAAMAVSPDGPPVTPLMSAAQHRRIVTEFSGAAVQVATPTPVHRWFERCVDQSPDAIAVLADCDLTADTLTYRELEERANRVAHWLRRRGVRAEDRIGVHLDRSLDLVVVLLGIFKAGATYVPLDPQLPAGRLSHILRDSAPVLCLSADEVGELPGDHEVLSVDRLREEFAACPVERPENGCDGLGAAYVVYTSGSTGAPKGVVITQDGLANLLGWMCTAFGFGPDDVTLHKTPLASDPSLWELLVPLMSGGRLVLAEPLNHGDPAYLLDVHDHYGVTACDFFPSLLRHFLAEPNVSTRARALRTVICGGEELNADLATRFAAALPTAGLHNLYGPTEATIAVTSQRVVPPVTDPISIGTPTPGAEIHVLDEHGGPQPIGVPGELMIAGIQLARGYQGLAGRTAERFVPHPFQPGARLYRTGDRARWREDGSLEFLGRLDHQIKIRGFRVEPAEVEAALLAHPGVSQALVLARPAPDGGHRLVGYLTRSPADPAADTASLRRNLARLLPSGMIPSAFVWLDSFPLTAIGKVDRDALPDPAAPSPVPPMDALREVLLGIWADTLPAARGMGVADEFKALGGDAEHAAQIAAHIRAMFRIDLSPDRIVGTTTVDGLTSLIRGGHPAELADLDRVARLALQVRRMSADEVDTRLRG